LYSKKNGPVYRNGAKSGRKSTFVDAD